jgi:hypothetical protein
MGAGKATTHRCPRCGSTLLSDAKAIWCSFVGGRQGPAPERPCTFGIDHPVSLVLFEKYLRENRLAEGEPR